MVARNYREILARRAGDLHGVHNRCGVVGVVSEDRGLVGAVGVHLEQRLYEHLSAVVVVPAGIENSSVFSYRGIGGVNLVVADADHIAAVGVADVEVGNGGLPAVDNLDCSRRREHYLAVGEPLRLYIADALSERNLLIIALFQIVDVEVIIVLGAAGLPAEHYFRAVGRYVGVAHDSVGGVDEHGF